MLRKLVAGAAIAGVICAGAQTKSGKPQRYLTQCIYDGEKFEVPDAPSSLNVLTMGESGVKLYVDAASETATTVRFRKEGKIISERSLRNMYNSNGWIAVSEDRRRVAINWSDGGALGGWHVTLASLSDAGQIEYGDRAVRAVEKSFSAGHFCKERGNNYKALRWVDNHRLLVSAQVYPTSDCGPDMGFTAAYVVDVASGKVERQLSEAQALRYPGVCTQNDDPSFYEQRAHNP